MRLSIPKLDKKLFLILIGILLLRLPSFFEPYWYGDEGIYLALGQAMQRGAVLYRDIWDNKPPLLYLIYAIIPTLLWAKITAAACVLATVTMVYKFTKKYWAAVTTGILLSLPFPLLEGAIANAELYFTLPIIIAAYFLWSNKHNLTTTLGIGLCFTMAFFLKVPTVFDFLGMFLAVSVSHFFEVSHLNLRTTKKFISDQVKFYLPIFLPFFIILCLTLGYFYTNQALSDFLTASFSQNASYVAVGTGPLSKLSNPLFIKAGLLCLALLPLVFLFAKKKISKELLFLASWFGFSLYGSLLSNRPYPHYLLQIVPPAIILLNYLFLHLKKYWAILILVAAILGQSLFFFSQPQILFDLLARQKTNYYSNFFDYISERTTTEDYLNYFDNRTSNNYELANYLATRTRPQEPIFVWGDNAFVYVLSDRPPATKFIQAHHLTTISPKNFDLIIERLQKYQPKFIIVSRPAHFAFPKLEEFIRQNYRFNEKFQDLFVYRSLSKNPPPKFDVNYR